VFRTTTQISPVSISAFAHMAHRPATWFSLATLLRCEG